MDATIRRLKDLFPGMHYMQYSLCLIKNKERNRYWNLDKCMITCSVIDIDRWLVNFLNNLAIMRSPIRM